MQSCLALWPASRLFVYLFIYLHKTLRSERFVIRDRTYLLGLEQQYFIYKHIIQCKTKTAARDRYQKKRRLSENKPHSNMYVYNWINFGFVSRYLIMDFCGPGLDFHDCLRHRRPAGYTRRAVGSMNTVTSSRVKTALAKISQTYEWRSRCLLIFAFRRRPIFPYFSLLIIIISLFCCFFFSRLTSPSVRSRCPRSCLRRTGRRRSRGRLAKHVCTRRTCEL